VHRVARKTYLVDGREKLLLTLGDWADGPNWLVEEDGRWEFEPQPIAGDEAT
jgi:hypothetical protein